MSEVGRVERGIAKATAMEAVGFEGTNKPSRWMGRTDGAAPTIGTFKAGDFVIDGSASVGIWICSVSGTPGTWAKAGGGGGAVLFVGPSAPTGSEVFWFDTDASC